MILPQSGRMSAMCEVGALHARRQCLKFRNRNSTAASVG